MNNPRWSKKQFEWRCRRGTKELDILLQRFFINGFERLDESQLDVLQRMLTEVEDPDLQPWLMGDKTPQDPDFISMVDLIRQAPI